MIDAHSYVFQYLFYRGFAISTILLIYLFLREGKNFYKNFFRIGISSILGGIFLATAFTGFIFSITMTSAALRKGKIFRYSKTKSGPFRHWCRYNRCFK